MSPHSHEAVVWVAGARSFIGSAIVRELRRSGHPEPVGLEDDPDLTDQRAVDAFFKRYRPSHVYLAAGRILGIGGNQRRPAELMLDNLLVNAHVIGAAYRWGVQKLLYLSSGCSYPKLAPQPMRPESLMSGSLEPTSEYYATAKLAGAKLCEAYYKQYGCRFLTAIPANPFGPGDDFDPEDAHVIAALMRKMHDAKLSGTAAVDVWGSGEPRRDFIFIDDLGSAAVHVMAHYDGPAPINLAAGREISIRELAEAIARIVGFRGRLRFDDSKPDGMPLKVFDASPLAALGWSSRTTLDEGLVDTYRWFVASAHREREATGA